MVLGVHRAAPSAVGHRTPSASTSPFFTKEGVDLAAVDTGGRPLPPPVDFTSQPAHLAGKEATRRLNAALVDGGSPQLRATREAQRSQAVVFAATHPDEVQRFLDSQGLDYPPGSADAIEAYADAVCGWQDAVTLEGLRQVQDAGIPLAPQTSVVIDDIDIVDIQLSPDAQLPTVEEIAAGNPTELMERFLAENPGSAELDERRKELASRNDGGKALAEFDARILTGLATTHMAASEDHVYAQSIGLSPVDGADKLSGIPKQFRGSVLSILAYLLGMVADKLSDDVMKKAQELAGSTDQSAQYELKAIVGKLEQVSGMASSLLQGVSEVLKEASRLR